jgi:SNF2 family DNA or RNA helicase
MMTEPESNIESGKFDEVTEKLDTIVSEKHRVLIFSSFVKHLSLYEHYCKEKGYKYTMLTGATTHREKVLSEFKNNSDVNVFLISLKAGGVGLNLTEADYVFMLDPWWNPAAEMQAINRAHRIGQNKNVFVYRFITKDTVEEKILTLQEKKKALADAFIKPKAAIAGMTADEIKQLFI